MAVIMGVLHTKHQSLCKEFKRSKVIVDT